MTGPVAVRADDAAERERLQALQQRLERSLAETDALSTQLAGYSARGADELRDEFVREQLREILSDPEFRGQLAAPGASAGYDGGFYIRSSDNSFSLKLGGQLTARYTHVGLGSRNRNLRPRLERDDRSGFDLPRTRLSLSGVLFDERLTYYMETTLDAPEDYDWRMLIEYVNYRFADELQVQMGTFKLASVPSFIRPTTNMSFTDLSTYTYAYLLGYGTGFRVWGRTLDDHLEYFFDIANSFTGQRNRTITPDPAELDGNPALVARVNWYVLGEKPRTDFSLESDLPRHESPAWKLGMHYGFNDDQGDRRTLTLPAPTRDSIFGARGGFEAVRSTGLQIHQFGWDTHFKYQGWSLLGEYTMRIVDPRRAGRSPFAPWWLLTGEDSTTVQHGAYVQTGYFLPIPGLENKIELLARVGGLAAVAEGHEGMWEYAAGVNYYIHGNSMKLQTDLTKVTEAPIRSMGASLPNVNDEALIWRVQLTTSF